MERFNRRLQAPSPRAWSGHEKVLRHPRALRCVGGRGPAQHLRKVQEGKSRWRRSMGGGAVQYGAVRTTSGLGLFFSIDQFVCIYTQSNALS